MTHVLSERELIGPIYADIFEDNKESPKIMRKIPKPPPPLKIEKALQIKKLPTPPPPLKKTKCFHKYIDMCGNVCVIELCSHTVDMLQDGTTLYVSPTWTPSKKWEKSTDGKYHLVWCKCCLFIKDTLG